MDFPEFLMHSLFVYSVFYCLNYTDISAFIREPILKRHNISKTQTDIRSKVIYHITYPFFCSYCFAFWLTICITFSLTTAFACAIASFVIDTKIKEYGK